jgi:hypothetical protein
MEVSALSKAWKDGCVVCRGRAGNEAVDGGLAGVSREWTVPYAVNDAVNCIVVGVEWRVRGAIESVEGWVCVGFVAGRWEWVKTRP